MPTSVWAKRVEALSIWEGRRGLKTQQSHDIKHPRDAEVADFDVEAIIEKDVVGFDVAVEDAFGVHVVHACEQLQEQAPQGRLREGGARGLAGGEKAGEGATGGVFGDDVQASLWWLVTVVLAARGCTPARQTNRNT